MKLSTQICALAITLSFQAFEIKPSTLKSDKYDDLTHLANMIKNLHWKTAGNYKFTLDFAEMDGILNNPQLQKEWQAFYDTMKDLNIDCLITASMNHTITQDGQKKYPFESNPAVSSRFERVQLASPSIEVLQNILEKLPSKPDNFKGYLQKQIDQAYDNE